MEATVVEVVPASAVTVEPSVFNAGTALETIELYEAAERVHRATDADVWGAFARYVQGIGYAELAGDALKAAEKSFKEKHDGAPLPNPYRSAKSIALSALKLGIKLTNPDGTARGKSAVQKDINEARAAARAAEDATLEPAEGTAAEGAAKDYLGVFLRAAANLKRHAFADLTPEQRQQVTDAIDALLA